MALDLPLASLIAISAITVIAGGAVIFWARLFRERKLSEVQALLDRPIVLRPGAQPRPETASAPKAEEPGEATLFVILFTDMVKKLSAAQSGREVPSLLVRTISNLIGAPSVAYFEYDEEARLLRLTEPLQQRAWSEVLRRTGGPLRATEVARALRLSREHLSRQFGAGGAPNLKRVIDLARTATAADLLRNPGYSVRSVARILGFSSASHLAGSARRVAGVAPRDLAALGPPGVLAAFLAGRTRSRA